MRQRQYVENPRWADYVISRYWDALQRVAPRGAMPLVDEGQSTVTFDEFGCGAFGCVYPTTVEGIVFKLTTDRSEAEFVSFAMDDPARGLVSYFDVFEFPPSDVTHSDKTIFAIWRAEARDTGGGIMTIASALYDDHDVEAFETSLRNFRRAADEVATFYFDTKTRAGAKVAIRSLQEAIEEMEGEGFDEDEFVNDADEAGAYFWLAVEAIEHMKETESGREVGKALDQYWRKGWLLTDLHDGNLGTVNDVIVITDPGVAVPLDMELLDIEIDRLPRPAKGAAN